MSALDIGEALSRLAEQLEGVATTNANLSGCASSAPDQCLATEVLAQFCGQNAELLRAIASQVRLLAPHCTRRVDLLEGLAAVMAVPATPDTRAVYLAECLPAHLLKIGVSKDPRARMKDLTRSSPPGVSVRLLAEVYEGGKALEGDLHRRFSAHQVEGEWFERATDILDWFKAKANRTYEVES